MNGLDWSIVYICFINTEDSDPSIGINLCPIRPLQYAGHVADYECVTACWERLPANSLNVQAVSLKRPFVSYDEEEMLGLINDPLHVHHHPLYKNTHSCFQKKNLQYIPTDGSGEGGQRQKLL
jgi:hypothetical protein